MPTFSFDDAAGPATGSPATGSDSGGFGFADAQPKPGPISYIAKQAKAGFTADVPQMVGKALQYAGADQVGGAIRRYGDENAAAAQPDEERGPVTRIAASIARGVAPFVPIAAANLTPAGPLVDAAAVPGLAATFGGSQAQDTYEKAKAAGLSDEEATSAARKTGAIMGVGMGAVGALTGGAAAPVARAIAGEGAGFVRPFLAEQATHLAGNISSMAAANAGTAAVENNAGIPGGPTPGEAALEGAGTGLGFTAGMLPFGAMSTAMAMRAARARSAQGPISQAAGFAPPLALPAPTVHVDSEGRAKMDGVTPPAFDSGQQEGVHGRAPIDTNWPQLTNEPDMLLTFPDGTTAYRSEVEAHIASLPPEQQIQARAALLGMAPQPAGPMAQAAALAPRLPAPSITADAEGNAATADQRQAARTAQAQEAEGRGGVLETGAIGQGRNSDQVDVPQGLPALPAPAISVDHGGTAKTLEQRQQELQVQQQQRDARGGISETGAMGQGRNGAPPEFEPKPGDVVVDDHFGGHAAATSPLSGREEPTEAQKSAENYKVGRTEVGGMDISVENAQGTVRKGTDTTGKPWQTTMRDHYGRILGTEGADSTPAKLQHLDAFIKTGTPKDWAGDVFVVDSKDPRTGLYDEHKVVFGAHDEADARRVFARNYDDGEARIGGVTQMSLPKFKEWAYDGKKDKPLAPEAAAAAAPHEDAAGGAGAAQPHAAGDRVAVPAGVRSAEDHALTPPAEAAKPSKGLRVGTTPGDAVPVEVKDGIIHVGGKPALNYDSGEPIPVRQGATAPEIAKALRDAGALSKKQRIFGAKEEAAPVFTLSGSDRPADVAAAHGQQDIFSAAPADPFAIEDTRERRRAVLDRLGDGWTARDGIEGTRDLFKKREGTLEVSLMRQRTADGNFYVGSYDVKTKRGDQDSSPKTLEEAKAAADRMLAKAAPDAEKGRWLKALEGHNRLAAKEGRAELVLLDGKLTFYGDPKATKAGRALLGTYEEVRKAGATDAEIVDAVRPARKSTGTEMAAPEAEEGFLEKLYGASGERSATPDIEAQVAEIPAPKPDTITDVGEKIGGARKDTATPTGRTRRTTEEDSRPTWAKRFKISQVVRAGGRIGDIKDEGRWVINDSRSLDWMKQPKQVGTSFATKEEAEAFLPIAAVSAKHRIVPIARRAPTEAQVDAMLKEDMAAAAADDARPGKIAYGMMQSAKDRLATGRLTQADFDKLQAKYGEEAKQYTPPAVRRDPSGDGYEIWRDITDRKRVKVVDQVFATRDEAKEYMARHAAEILDTNTTFGEADMPLPPDRARTGPDRRQGDVKGDDFKDAFGLRGVEFGNWNNQDERQGLMNDAYDGLMDLAHVLGVPPKAIGLNGDLALAFGARGHGLSGARAHYEPERAVINLTKERGAGSLAHEWFHALDFYLGRKDGKASSKWEVGPDGTRTLKADVPDAASHGFSRESGVRPELRAAYDKVLQTIAKKATQYVEDTVKADNFTGRAREDLANELDSLRKNLAEQKDPSYWKRNNKPATAEQLAEFDGIAKRMLDGEAQAITTDWRGVQGPKALAFRWTNDALEQLGAIYKAVRGRGGFDSTNRSGTLDRLRGTMERYSQRLKQLADAQQGTEKTRMVPTDFAMNAKELDQGRGTDYWTTPHEMAARAFQGFVEDRISQEGGVSRFLNYGPENVGILTPWGAKRPFPAGEERQAINAALDKFVKTLQTRETDKGTELYRREDDVMPSGLTMSQVRDRISQMRGRMSVDKAQEVVDRLTKDWKGGIGVKVVASPKDLPIDDPHPSARGLYKNGTGYIVAGKHTTEQDIGKTLAHEVIAHFGLRNSLGEEDWGRLMKQVQAAANAGNPEIAAARDYVRQAYRDGKGGYLLQEGGKLESDEVAARLIERSVDENGAMRPKLQWLKWVWAKVAGFLRSVGLDIPLTMPELHGIFVAARRDIENGREMLPQLQRPAMAAQEPAQYALDDVKKTLDRVKGTQTMREVGTAWDGLLRAVAPQFRSPEALETARQIIAGMGTNEVRGIRFRADLDKAIVEDDKAQTVAQKARDLLEKGLTVAADKVFLRQSPEENRAFMQAMDTGDADYFAKHPNLKGVADTIAKMFSEKAAAVQALDTGALRNVRENYFPHIWDREPAGDKQQEIFSQLSKRPFEGQKGFTKERIFDDVQAGLDAGFEPVSNNPLDLVMLKMQEMDKYLLAHQTLKAMEGTDGVHLIGAGEKAPTGYTDINGRFGNIERDGQKLRYVGRDDVAQVVNNYVSPNLYHNKYVGKPFTGYMKAANLLNQFQLGVFSAFHAGFTSMEAVISHASIGLKALSAGDLAGAAKYLSSAPTAWIQNPRLGGKIIDALVNGTDHPEMARIVEGLELAGAKWQMDERFRTGATKDMLAAWGEGRKFASAAHAIGAITEQSARPILEWLVPRQKFGVFGEMYNKWIVDHPDASHEDLRNAAQQIWNRVDSRLGQVVYDRLFVHNVAKNFGQMLVRAPGWTGGTILELGGGVKDLATWAAKVATGQKPESISDRAAYTLSLLMVSAITNAALTGMFTGQSPQDWRDLVAFRTGNIDEYGRPERFQLPTYEKDLYSYSQGVGHTLVNKTHPLLSLVGDIARNRDYMGSEVRSEDAGFFTQLAQSAGYAAKAFVPFWVKGVQAENERGGSTMSKVAPLVGVMPAPTDLNKTEAEKLVSKYGADRMPVGSRTAEETARTTIQRQMYVALRRGDREAAADFYRQGRAQGLLAPNALMQATHEAVRSPLQNGFQRLTFDQAQRVIAAATPEERVQLMPMFLRKQQQEAMRHSGMLGSNTL